MMNKKHLQPSGIVVLATIFTLCQPLAATSALAAGRTQSTKRAAPETPSGLVATVASVSQINLSWTDNSTNETGFSVARGTSSTGPWLQIAAVGAGVTSFSNPGLSASTTYFYRVRATSRVGDSAYSNTASATTTTETVPAAPSGLAASAVSASQISLSWTDTSMNETGFTVERAMSSTGPWNPLGTTGASVVSYSDSGLAAATTCYYRVRATNAAGSSAYSNAASATTPAAPPAAPSGLTVTAISSSQINVSWTDNASNETGFKVERATASGGPWSQIGTTGTNIASFADTTVAASTTYYYRVQATNATGDSAYSNTASAATPGTLPAVPSGLTVTAISSSQINVSWTDNASNETGFKVERATASGGPWGQIGTTGTNIASFADTTVAASTTYYYRVRATNATGDSAYSNTASATTPAAAGGGSVIWAKSYGAQVLTDSSYVSGVAVDAGGSIFTAGRFTGTANLGGGNVPSGNGYDIYIAKYDADSTYRWAKHFNSNNIQSRTTAMAVDGGGNVLVTGSFFNTLDFGAPCAPITAISQDTFIVKLSSSGTCVWARNFTSNNMDGGAALAVDGSNNVIVAGGFQGTLDFGSGVILTGHSSSQSDIYLAKFNSSGGIVWAHNYSGTTNNGQTVYDVATDSSGNIAMTGAFKATVDFCAPGPACPLTAANNPISGPSNDAFIAKYTSGGVAVWVKSFGESQGAEQVGQAVAFDGAGNILATGYAGGDLNFGTGVVRFIGSLDLYVAKIASDGTTTWVRRYGAVGYDQYAYDLAVDSGSNVVIAGKTSGPVDFGSGPLPNPDGFSGRTNALGLKLSPSGSYVWVKSSGDNWFQSSRSVATDGSANAIFAGVFASTIDFGNGPMSSPGTSTDSIFVAKFGP